MKIKKIKPIRYRLTASFIMFAVLLMGILWLMQAVFLSQYYEHSMKSKCERALATVGTVYSSSENLTYDDFCSVLSSISAENDIYFSVEAADRSFLISSTEDLGQGRLFKNAQSLIEKAKLELVFGDKDTVSVSSGYDKATHTETIVYASYVSSKSYVPIYIYAVTSLTPIGPAVGIIRSQLLIISLISLVLAIITARWISKRLSLPIVKMDDQVKQLSSGNYDIHFDGGHEYTEVDNLADTLTQAAADMKKSDALQKDLMANVSHDLRTPLTMIKSYAEMIRDLSGDDPVKRDAHLGVIIEETDRLSDLVNDVFTLSKMQAGVIEMQTEDFDIQKAAENVLSTFMVLSNEGYNFKYIPLEESVIVHGDERKIQQVISNLISNAVRYSEVEKEITLKLEKTEDGVCLSVIDKGIGIADEDLDKIWHRYEKASQRGQRSSSGTGLGLSIAAEILELHHAKYGVDSALGRGSTFWFELPSA